MSSSRTNSWAAERFKFPQDAPPYSFKNMTPDNTSAKQTSFRRYLDTGTRAMRRRYKTLLWIALPTLSVVGFVWITINRQRGIKSAYYQWGVTCMIASYAEEHDGMPPTGWDELVGYEYHTHYLPDPRTTESASQYVSVDFESLLSFKNEKISKLPADVVTPTRGINQQLIYPSRILERYFRDGERPQGSFDDDFAKRIRYYAEQRD